MPSFGEVIMHMVTTIISSIIETSATLINDVIILFQILSGNSGKASPFALLIGIVMLATIMYALLKMFKGDLRTLIIAAIVLTFLMIMALFIGR